MSFRSTLKNLVDRLVENWEIKVISLLIAVGLWFYIKNLNVSEYEVYIPVHYTNLPSNFVILNYKELPKYASLKIKTFKSEAFSASEMKYDSIVAIVDLSKSTKDGKYKVMLSRPLPSSGLTYSISPSEVYVDIEVLTNTFINVVPSDENYISIPDKVVVYFPLRESNKVSNFSVSIEETNRRLMEIYLPSNENIRYDPSKVYLSNTNF